jgi:hypothetical protein
MRALQVHVWARDRLDFKKKVRRIIKTQEVQLVNYLVETGKPVGLILNFGERKVDIKRKIKACPGAM